MKSEAKHIGIGFGGHGGELRAELCWVLDSDGSFMDSFDYKLLAQIVLHFFLLRFVCTLEPADKLLSPYFVADAEAEAVDGANGNIKPSKFTQAMCHCAPMYSIKRSINVCT